MKSPSNNFDYRGPINGKIETVIDSSKLSSFKCDDDSQKNGKTTPKSNNNSRFSRIGGGSQSPVKEKDVTFEGMVRRSTGNIREEDNESNRNRSSLSPTHKKQAKGNEIYKMAIMNQKKKNEFEMFKN